MIYITYYTTPDDLRKNSPAANSKTVSISKALAKNGINVEISGIVGFIPWVAMFFVDYKMLFKEFKEKAIENDLLIVSFLYVFVLSFFNPIGYVFEVTIAAFFIVPIWCNLISKKKECE